MNTQKITHARSSVVARGCWIVVLLVACTGCATVLNRSKAGVMERSFVLTREEISREVYPDAGAGPEALLAQGVRAWQAGSFEQAGDVFQSAYNAGKAEGWYWKTDAKIRILGHSLRAYHLAGAVAKEVRVGNYMMGELTGTEKLLLPPELKVLLYWATVNEPEPAFAGEVPRSVEIDNNEP